MSQTEFWIPWWRVVVLFVLLIARPVSAQFSFTPLDGLPPGSRFRSQIWAFPPSGPTATGRFGSENGTEAYRWTAETGIVGLGDLPGGTFYSWAHGISADGLVIVGESDYRGPVFQIASNTASQAFRWTAESGMVGLGTLPDALWSCATAASEDGSVVVGFSGSRAFRWTASEGMKELVERKPRVYSEAIDVSADGNAVVGTIGTDSSHDEAFHWTPETGITRLGPGSYPYALSADGSVVVGTLGHGVPGGAGAAYWTAGEGWVNLGLTTPATDVSADGGVIASGPNLWLRDSGWIDLREVLISNGIPELENWSRFMVFDVSPDGKTIAGRGQNPLGENQAWIATIPEPSTFVLAALAAASVTALGVRRRRVLKMRRPGNSGDIAIGNCP